MGDMNFVILVRKATGLTFESTWTISLRKKPHGYVTIQWMSGSKRKVDTTRVIKGDSPIWEERFPLLSQSLDSTILFEMFDQGYTQDHSYGTVEKTIRDLLVNPKQDIIFPTNGAILSIAIERAETVISRIIIGPHEAIESPYAPLGEVVNFLARLMDTADTISEIHPYAKFAWRITSLVYKIVKDQLERNNGVHDLLKTMAGLYSHSLLLKPEQNTLSKDVVDTIQHILQQTIECSLFIQEYNDKGFSPIANALSTADRKISKFKETFIELRRCLDTGLSVQVALTSIHISRGIDKLTVGIDKLALEVEKLTHKVNMIGLNQAEMGWTARPTCHHRTQADIHPFTTEWIVDRKAEVLQSTDVVGTLTT